MHPTCRNRVGESRRCEVRATVGHRARTPPVARMTQRRARRQAAPAFRPSAPAAPGVHPVAAQAIALLAASSWSPAGIAVASFVVKPSQGALVRPVLRVGVHQRQHQPGGRRPGQRQADRPAHQRLHSGVGDSDHRPRRLSARRRQHADARPAPPASSTWSTAPVSSSRRPAAACSCPRSHRRRPRQRGAGRRVGLHRCSRSAYRTSIYLVGQLTVVFRDRPHAGAKARAYATVNRAARRRAACRRSAPTATCGCSPSAGARHARDHPASVPPGSNAGRDAHRDPARHGHRSGRGRQRDAQCRRHRRRRGGGRQLPARSRSSHGEHRRRCRSSSTARRPTSCPRPMRRARSCSSTTRAGWSQVTAPAAAPAPAQRHQLTRIAADAPADRAGRERRPPVHDGHHQRGDLWQIDADGTAAPGAGASHLPVAAQREASICPQRAGARSRQPGHLQPRANYDAEVVFSDGSHAPRTIDKHSAVQVDPTGATALADAHATGKTKPRQVAHKPTQGASDPAQTINNKIDCKTTTQNPHIPTLIAGDRAARARSG